MYLLWSSFHWVQLPLWRYLPQSCFRSDSSQSLPSLLCWLPVWMLCTLAGYQSPTSGRPNDYGPGTPWGVVCGLIPLPLLSQPRTGRGREAESAWCLCEGEGLQTELAVCWAAKYPPTLLRRTCTARWNPVIEAESAQSSWSCCETNHFSSGLEHIQIFVQNFSILWKSEAYSLQVCCLWCQKSERPPEFL